MIDGITKVVLLIVLILILVSTLLNVFDIPMGANEKDAKSNEFLFITLSIYLFVYFVCNIIIPLLAYLLHNRVDHTWTEWRKRYAFLSQQATAVEFFANIWNIILKTILLIFLFFLPTIIKGRSPPADVSGNKDWHIITNIESYSGSTIIIGILIFCFILIKFIILSDNTDLSFIYKLLQDNNTNFDIFKDIFKFLAFLKETNIFKKFGKFFSIFKPLVILFLIYTILHVSNSNNINIDYKLPTMISAIIATIVISMIMKYNNKKSDTTISNIPYYNEFSSTFWQRVIRFMSVLPGLNLVTKEFSEPDNNRRINLAKNWANHKPPSAAARRRLRAGVNVVRAFQIGRHSPLVAAPPPGAAAPPQVLETAQLGGLGGLGRVGTEVWRTLEQVGAAVLRTLAPAQDANRVLFNRFSIDDIGYSVSSTESMLYILYFIILFMIVFLKNNIFIENMGLTIPIMFIIGLIFIGYGVIHIWYFKGPSSGYVGLASNQVIKVLSSVATIVLSLVFFCLSLEGTWIFKKVECVIKNFVHIIKNILYSMPYHTIISLLIVIFLFIKFPQYALIWIIGFFIFMMVSLKVFVFIIMPLMLIVFYVVRSVITKIKDSTNEEHQFDFILNVLKWISSCFMDPSLLKNKYNELEKNKIGKTTKLLLLFEIVVILLIIVCPIILNHLRKHGGNLLLRDEEDQPTRGPQNLNKQTKIVYSEIRNDVKNTIDVAIERGNQNIWDLSKVSMFDSATDTSRTYNFALSMWIYINKFDKSTNNAYAYNFDNNRGVVILNYLKIIKLKYNNQTDNLEIYNGNRKIHQTVDYKFQKWNNIVLNYSNGTLDVFINDKLVISKSNIRFRDNSINEEIVIGTNAGENLIGGVKDVYYYNTNISRNMIHLIYYL